MSLIVVGIAFFAIDSSSDYWALSIILLIQFGVLYLLWIARLDLQVNKAGVYYCWFPWHLSLHFIAWEAVAKAHVRKYRALSEYGGWGIKGTRKNRAFNISGDFGLQLELLDGRKLLIETSKPKELELLIDSLMKNQITF